MGVPSLSRTRSTGHRHLVGGQFVLKRCRCRKNASKGDVALLRIDYVFVYASCSCCIRVLFRGFHQAAIEGLSSVGAVTVTTASVVNSTAFGGRTGEVTFGSPYVTPSADVSAVVSEGDWIRLCDDTDGLVCEAVIRGIDKYVGNRLRTETVPIAVSYATVIAENLPTIE